MPTVDPNALAMMDQVLRGGGGGGYQFRQNGAPQQQQPFDTKAMESAYARWQQILAELETMKGGPEVFEEIDYEVKMDPKTGEKQYWFNTDNSSGNRQWASESQWKSEDFQKDIIGRILADKNKRGKKTWEQSYSSKARNAAAAEAQYNRMQQEYERYLAEQDRQRQLVEQQQQQRQQAASAPMRSRGY